MSAIRLATVQVARCDAHFIFELVILLHVFLFLAFDHLPASLVHSAMLLKLWVLEHAYKRLTCYNNVRL